MTPLEKQLPKLRDAIACYADVSLDALHVLPTTGLAHDHIVVEGTDWLLRVPRQSQMQLDAAHNLNYQATCFERMSASGHTPACHAQIEPCADIPMGALLVDYIKGHPLQPPKDMHLVAQTLAAIHALPLIPTDQRAPLIDQKDPMSATLEEVLGQAQFIPKANLSSETVKLINREIKAAKDSIANLPVSPVTLVSFDAHPGNFIVNKDNRAYLVDLEKGRYSGAGFDLAHASLYTSTTWDVASYSELSPDEIKAFYAAWMQAMPQSLAEKWQPFLMPMRRLMWLWSITWCAKWSVESNQDLKLSKHKASDTEDWSAENTDDDLIAHVRGRVEQYLKPEIIERVCADWYS